MAFFTVDRRGGVPTVDFPTATFFKKFFFCRFLRKKIQTFFYETDNFSSENLVGRKNFKKQIGEVKKNYEKNFDREKFIT